MLVKICGITTEEAFDATVESGADLMGFVFFPGSPRNIPWAAASKFKNRVRGTSKKVAVVVNANNALIKRVLDCLEPDFIQMHGREPAHRVGDVAVSFGVPTIKATRIARRVDISRAGSYQDYASYVLLDSKSYSKSRRFGVTEPEAFDLSFLKSVNFPYLLAGGVDHTNVSNYLSKAGPLCLGVDVSSGVEEALGVKSSRKIKQFVRTVREVTFKLKGKRHGEQEKACCY